MKYNFLSAGVRRMLFNNFYTASMRGRRLGPKIGVRESCGMWRRFLCVAASVQ